MKSNLGHTEAAAGIAGLTKVLLQLKHGKIAPTLHCERLNPRIDFESSPFFVQRSLSDWPAQPGQPRRAAISSFGAGGVNAHVIVEEFVQPKDAARCACRRVPFPAVGAIARPAKGVRVAALAPSRPRAW